MVIDYDSGAFSADGRIVHVWGHWYDSNSAVGNAMETWDLGTGKRTSRVLLPGGSVVSPDCRTYLAYVTDATGAEVLAGLELRAVGADKALQYWKGR